VERQGLTGVRGSSDIDGHCDAQADSAYLDHDRVRTGMQHDAAQ
jgi:hypothetical protein